MTRRAAVVLGGGGVAGIAWQTGLLAGLAEAGVDLSAAGLVLGTSAGATTGALLADAPDWPALVAAQLDPRTTERAVAHDPAEFALLVAARLPAEPVDEPAVLAAVGAAALAARTPPAAERREIIAARLPGVAWSPRLRITAVDAHTGALVVFSAADGVDLVDAVAASSAVPGVWPPVRVRGRVLIDGGVRSSTNADQAPGQDRVLVVAPVPEGHRPAPDGRELLLTPDPGVLPAAGPDLLDPARRPAACRAGLAQAGRVAAEVRAFWA